MLVRFAVGSFAFALAFACSTTWADSPAPRDVQRSATADASSSSTGSPLGSARGAGHAGSTFRECWEAHFDLEVRGELTSVARLGHAGPFKEVGTAPTSQTYVFCFTTLGRPGSGMFAGPRFVELRQEEGNGVLTGRYRNLDKTVTLFNYVNRTDALTFADTSRPDLPEGTALLQIVPNVTKFQAGIPVIELRGASRPTRPPGD